jgi:hypothetical protein
MGTPNAFADVRALFEYGFSRYVRARLAQRGQPVSERAGGPADSQTSADVDALVRLDQLDEVRLALAPGAASAWFTAGGRRLAQVRLDPMPAGGPTAPTTTVAPAPPAAPPTAGTDPAAETITAGAVVRVHPVPPGAPSPAIDPSLRRGPP